MMLSINGQHIKAEIEANQHLTGLKEENDL